MVQIAGSDVVADVAVLASQAESAVATEAIIESVIESANERVGQAEQVAEQITQGAMESARGQEIENLRKEFYTWRDKQENQASEMDSLKSQLAELTGQISALALLQVTSPQTPMELSSLTPPTSETEEAIAEVQAILPESLSESVVEESPVPLPVRKRRLL